MIQPLAIRAELRRALPPAAAFAFDYFPRLQRLERFALENLDSPISRGLAAKLLGFDPSAFSRYFSGKTGMTFLDWLTTLRITYATWLIETQSLSLTILAVRSGFPDERALRRAFVRVHGICPRGYRKRLLRESGGQPPAPITLLPIPATDWSIAATLSLPLQTLDPYKSPVPQCISAPGEQPDEN